MVIRVGKLPGDTIGVIQIPLQPLVYFDNWVYNWFYKNRESAIDFQRIMNIKHGTLAVSFINALEIARKEDEAQVKFALEFIDQIDSVFIETNIQRVFNEEEFYRKNGFLGITLDACMDSELIKYFDIKSDGFNEFKVSKIIQRLHDDLKDGSSIEENFEREMRPLIERVRSDRKTLFKAKSRYSSRSKLIGEVSKPYTKEIFGLCIDFINVNQTMKMENKEWRDICHVIVPVSYCDFVLIDKRWTLLIRDSGLRFPKIASVYWQNEMVDFMKNLEQSVLLG